MMLKPRAPHIQDLAVAYVRLMTDVVVDFGGVRMELSEDTVIDRRAEFNPHTHELQDFIVLSNTNGLMELDSSYEFFFDFDCEIVFAHNHETTMLFTDSGWKARGEV